MATTARSTRGAARRTERIGGARCLHRRGPRAARSRRERLRTTTTRGVSTACERPQPINAPGGHVPPSPRAAALLGGAVEGGSRRRGASGAAPRFLGRCYGDAPRHPALRGVGGGGRRRGRDRRADRGRQGGWERSGEAASTADGRSRKRRGFGGHGALTAARRSHQRRRRGRALHRRAGGQGSLTRRRARPPDSANRGLSCLVRGCAHFPNEIVVQPSLWRQCLGFLSAMAAR